MSTTTNKGLNQPALASAAWGTPLNDNATILDRALGAFEEIGGTTGVFNLTAEQCQYMCLKSGTSEFVSDVTYVIPSGIAGQWVVKNQSASSAFSLIVKNAASVASVSIPSGKSYLVYSDGAGVTFSDDPLEISTQAQAEAATNNTTAMSPLRTTQQITSLLATQVQAEAGTDNTKLMTPLRVAQTKKFNYQEFTASGTYTKPAYATADTVVIVEMWAGGGGGGRANGTGAEDKSGGGGGGGYFTFTRLASELAETVAITVGAGGVGGVSTGVNGTSGGNSSFGSLVTAFGGVGGRRNSSDSATGGDGGGLTGVGGLWAGTGADDSSSNTSATAGEYWGGGGGGAGDVGSGAGSQFGGGGGGGSGNSGSVTGGLSLLGGDGGNGRVGTGAGTAGGVRGGGGGAGRGGAGGNGGRGEVRVWTIG